jgi:outer membrane protein
VKDRLLKLLYCSGLAWLSGSCHAQSLMDVYQKARIQDSQYGAARRSLDAALEKLPQARAGFLPTINLVGNSNRQTGEASFSDAPFVNRDVKAWSWTTQITQPLIRPGNWATYAQANAQVIQAKEQFALAEQELIVRTAQVYFDVQVALQNAQVADAQLQAINEQLALAKRTYEVGMGTVTDVHEAKAKQALSLAQRVTAKNDLTTKQAELEKLIGEYISLPPMQLTGSLPALDVAQLNDWLTLALDANPQIRIQQAALTVASKEVSKSNAAHAPTLDLVVSRAGNYSSGSLSSPADLATRVNSNQVGLQLNIPLFAGGATQSKVRESLALEEKAREDLINAQRNASSQVRQTFASVMNGQAQVEALEAAVEASKNSVESNKIGFNVGTRINPDVLNAEQQLYTAMRDLSKARADTVIQSLKLKATAGSLASDDLAALEKQMQPNPPAASNLEAQSTR